MRRSGRWLAGICAAWMLAGWMSAMGGEPPEAMVIWRRTAEHEDGPWWQWFKERVQAGFRISYFQLLDNTRRKMAPDGTFAGGFLGSIDRLEEDQSLWPMPVLGLYPLPWLGLELSWDVMEVRALTYFDDHSDGKFNLSGPSLLLVARWPEAGLFAPYAGLGFIFFSADFDMSDPWHHGFKSDEAYKEWRAAGSPPWPNQGYQRNIECDDSAVAVLLQAGCQLRCHRHVVVDVGLRYAWLDLDAHYWLSFYGEKFEDYGTFSFPLSFWSGYVGVSYLF